MDRRDMTADPVARVAAEQFPRWADTPVAAVPLNGWDNTTLRFGWRYGLHGVIDRILAESP